MPTRTVRAAAARRLIVVLPILLIAGYVAYRVLTRTAPSIGDLQASGTIEATEADVSPRVGGRMVTLTVDEGARVRKGDLIATLDSPELADRVTQARASLLAAQARLADLLAGTRRETIRNLKAGYSRAQAAAAGSRNLLGTARASYAKSNDLKAALVAADVGVRTSQKARDAATARLKLVRLGPRQEEIDQLRAAVEQSRALELNADQDLRRLDTLHAQGAISTQQLDRAKAGLDSQHAATVLAEARLRAARTGSRPEEIAEAEAQLAQADAALDGAHKTAAIARTQYQDRLQALQTLQSATTSERTSQNQVASAKAELDLAVAGATRDAIAASRAQVRQADGALSEAQSQLEQTRLYAPSDGIVTVKYREVGEVISAGSPVVRVADLSHVWLRVYAPLPALGRVKVGQAAFVVADTFPGKRYEGHVASIREEAEFTPKNVQTTEERVKLVYGIRIDLDNRAGELKPGMPADATIHFGAGR
jgi:HlyD family secretion protein